MDDLVARFIRAKYDSRCRNCGGEIKAGEEIHWMRDAKRTWVSHPSWCPGAKGEEQRAAAAAAEAAGRGEQ